ncbi:MAG: iron-containing alcohol dehydrogenase, partial [Bacilli bacterium]
HVKRVLDQLNARSNNVVFEIFSQVMPDPTIEIVIEGFKRMEIFKPDVIIALGGGSPMDAAKGMWLYYEKPDVDFDDLKQKFIDIRKRAIKYPKMGVKARLVCIPTTSGTGSEVTPFAVITNEKENKKYPLADYALTPSVAIIDPVFVKDLPASVSADTGMDVLTHAIEAYVSILANDFTDGLALQAIRLVFKYLPRSVKYLGEDMEAREKMHNASSIAGMAFANSFLGINHSLAHKIGGEYHVPHGRANAILLPHVIRYNGTFPAKPAPWPKYQYYCADEKYAEICDAIGIKYQDKEDASIKLAAAIESLAQEIGIKTSFKEYGLNEQEYMNNLDKIALLAYEDQCSPANPRLPLVSEMKEILIKAYHNKN